MLKFGMGNKDKMEAIGQPKASKQNCREECKMKFM